MSLFTLARKAAIAPRQARSIWTGITTTGSSIEECVQVTVNSVKTEEAPDVCVVLASKSFLLQNYKNLIKELDSQLKPKLLLGGVVDRVPQLEHGISVLLGYDEKVVPFTIEDSDNRLKIRNISVGRWGRVEDTERLKSQSDHVDQVGWKNFGSVSTPIQTYALPTGLEEKPSFVFTVSDNEPDELLQALDHHYPDVSKVGIVGSSTPFVTGMPFTLFHGDKLMNSGIVGFASYGKTKPETSVSHTAMEKLGDPVKITRCRGNIILDLDQGGATGLLLKLIQGGNITKDEEFYLGIYPPNQDESSKENVTVSRITSGDPGRGNMSVDTTADLQIGQTVQFLKKKCLKFKNVCSKPLGENEISFGVIGKDFTIDAAPVKIPEEATLLPDVFGAVSENGVILGRSNIPSEVLDVPYSKITIKL